MAKPLSRIDPSKGLLHLGLRMPILLYRARLGWLLGDRFLMLTTVGRKTGLPRQTVLEVVLHDKQTDTYTIASGWGDKSDWYRNLQVTSRVKVAVGGRRFEADAVCLSPPEAERVLKVYASQHSFAARYLSNLLTGEKSASLQDQVVSLANSIPLIALQPLAVRS